MTFFGLPYIKHVRMKRTRKRIIWIAIYEAALLRHHRATEQELLECAGCFGSVRASTA